MGRNSGVLDDRGHDPTRESDHLLGEGTATETVVAGNEGPIAPRRLLHQATGVHDALRLSYSTGRILS